MPSTIDEFQITLRSGTPREGKCPINDLPNELLSYVFQLDDEIIEKVQWVEDFQFSKWQDVDDNGVSVNSGDSISRALSVDTDTDWKDDQVQQRDTLPSEVLVSHVCRRWRSVALNTHRLWTTLCFRMHLGLAQEYISRSNGLPLTIQIIFNAEDYPPDGLGEPSDSTGDEKELDQILDLLEPAISQWGIFIFCAYRYTHVRFLMSRLDKFPAAPCLETFQVHSLCRGTETPPEHTPRYLPFGGQAPNLKEVTSWEIPIDWERALPNFLRGLRDLELSDLRQDVRPTYATFAEIIKNSPELHSLTLSNAGPVLADLIPFDSHAAWGPIPLAAPSLTKLVLQYYDQKNATALVQHLDMPNVTHLDFDFDTLDHSEFVQALAKPVKGRDQSLLRQITHLNLTGLSFDSTSMKALLSESVSLKSLYLKLPNREDKVICDALVDPRVLPIGPASVDLPGIFCPQLEEIAASFDDERAKALIIGRRDAGVPLKRIRRLRTMVPTYLTRWTHL